MNKLIYYPTFEPTDTDWLKYSLIYIDRFSPIIPESGKTALSSTFRKLQDDTDLIDVHEPKWQQGDNATTKFIKEIEFMEKHPELYIDKFNNPNIIRTWKDKKNWIFKLYEEKYSIPFKYYCLERAFGRECSGGILTSKELAEFFMTFLVEEVAFEKGGNPITDNKELDKFSTYLRSKSSNREELLSAARAVTQLFLPSDINKISIDRFIKFRNDTGIKELRQSFNKTLNSFYSSVEDDFNSEEYVSSIQKTNSEFIKEMGLFFGGIVSTTLGGLILIQNPNNLELLKQITEGTILAIAGGYSISKSWEANKDERYARKFLSNVRSI